MNPKYNKLNLNSHESRNYRNDFNPLIFGNDFYFTEKALSMKKPNQYPFLKYTFDSKYQGEDDPRYIKNQVWEQKGNFNNFTRIILIIDEADLFLDYENGKIIDKYHKNNKEFRKFVA